METLFKASILFYLTLTRVVFEFELHNEGKVVLVFNFNKSCI